MDPDQTPSYLLPILCFNCRNFAGISDFLIILFVHLCARIIFRVYTSFLIKQSAAKPMIGIQLKQFDSPSLSIKVKRIFKLISLQEIFLLH